MKKVIVTLLLGFTAFCTYAQPSKAEMAQVQYGKAEEFFAAANYIECLNWLQKAETSVGENNPKIQHLRVKAHYAKKDLLEAFEACNVYFTLPTVTKGSDKYNEIMNIYVELEPQAEQLRAEKTKAEAAEKERLAKLQPLLEKGGLFEPYILGKRLIDKLNPSLPSYRFEHFKTFFFNPELRNKDARLFHFDSDKNTFKVKTVKLSPESNINYDIEPHTLIYLDSILIYMELHGMVYDYSNVSKYTTDGKTLKAFKIDNFIQEMTMLYGKPLELSKNNTLVWEIKGNENQCISVRLQRGKDDKYAHHSIIIYNNCVLSFGYTYDLGKQGEMLQKILNGEIENPYLKK